MTSAGLTETDWSGEGVTIGKIERELARLRDESAGHGSQPNLRTSVMTHIAWVPARWQAAAEETLAGMAERHPSRTLLLVPRPEADDDRLDAQLSLRCFPVGARGVCGEVIELELRGRRAVAPASIVEPLLISDLPVFCRWRGEPPFGAAEFVQMVAVVDRLVVDSEEWDELRYSELAQVFDRVAVSDIAWRRAEAWRFELAKRWPAIREQRISVRGPRAESTLLRAWLAARLGRDAESITVEPGPELGVRLDDEDFPQPRPLYATPSDLLSAELDQFTRDRIYEEAVRTAA
ncbi:MAG: glucose-6-phosphate dehydrogenase assembly protein OpcA [Thermoleophilia bacterium]|nr:glucose-6-phosphate dehydrogenase assembly protein OpcA [Thermoleophilia bacterium]